MTTATVLVCGLLAALLTASAFLKLSHRQQVVQGYARVGVPEDKLNALAFVLLAAAAGLILGLFWAPLGIAAASGVACYFAVAIAFHVRSRDIAHLAMPVFLDLMAIAALTLRLIAP